MAKSTGELYQAATAAAHDARRKKAKTAQALLERKAAAWDKVVEAWKLGGMAALRPTLADLLVEFNRFDFEAQP